MVSSDFRKMLDGFSLTTAEITYRLPDYRDLLQMYIWQEYDVFPAFPNLHKFLNFWTTKLDGPIHSVRVAHCNLIKPTEILKIDFDYLH